MKKTSASMHLIYLVASLISRVTWADTGLVELHVKGVVCSFCAAGIEKILIANPNVESVAISLRTAIVTVHFKSEKTVRDEELKKLIQDAGYEVSSIEHR